MRFLRSVLASFCAFGAEGVKFVVGCCQCSFEGNLDFDAASSCAFGELLMKSLTKIDKIFSRV